MNDIVLRTNFAQKLALTGYRIMLSYYGALRQSHWNRWHLFSIGTPDELLVRRASGNQAHSGWLRHVWVARGCRSKTKGLTVWSIFPREAS